MNQIEVASIRGAKKGCVQTPDLVWPQFSINTNWFQGIQEHVLASPHSWLLDICLANVIQAKLMAAVEIHAHGKGLCSQINTLPLPLLLHILYQSRS